MTRYLLRFEQGGYIHRTETDTLERVREITQCSNDRIWQLALNDLTNNGISRNIGWWDIVDTQHEGKG